MRIIPTVIAICLLTQPAWACDGWFLDTSGRETFLVGDEEVLYEKKGSPSAVCDIAAEASDGSTSLMLDCGGEPVIVGIKGDTLIADGVTYTRNCPN